jgi:hypothetical protein
MILQLCYPDVRSVRAGIDRNNAKADGCDDELRICYEVRTLAGERVTCRGGRYEKSNPRAHPSYREHAEESALRAKLQAAVGAAYRVRSVPVPTAQAAPGSVTMVYFEAVQVLPLSMDVEVSE